MKPTPKIILPVKSTAPRPDEWPRFYVEWITTKHADHPWDGVLRGKESFGKLKSKKP